MNSDATRSVRGGAAGTTAPPPSLPASLSPQPPSWDLSGAVMNTTSSSNGAAATGPPVSATELFSAALQRLGGSRSTATTTAANSLAALHRECDSDGFLDSDDDCGTGRGQSGGWHPRARAGVDDEEDEDEESASSSSLPSSSSSSSDGMWGTFTGGEPKLPRCDDDDDELATSGDGAEDGVLFVPDPIFDLSSLQQKAVMPCLRAEQIPLGAEVWVVDEDDVATQLNCHFSASYLPVCNGRLSGEVMRHTGKLTLVRFRSTVTDLHFTLCLPTSCLSLKPIEPYDTPNHRDDACRMSSGAYGMLGPRAAGRGRSAPSGREVLVRHCLYEAMPAYDFEKARGTTLERAQAAFFGGSFEKALTAVNEFIDTQSMSSPGASASLSSGSGDTGADLNARLTTSGPAAVPVPKTAALVDALLLRSRIFVFLERHHEALADAQRCVTLEPQWVRGYLSVARAQCGLGQFTEAAVATAQACMLLPYSLDLERLKELNSYMHHLQSQLRAQKAGCYLILDGYYRKRLRVSAATMADTRLCSETTPIVATHSVFVAKEPVHRCSVCFRDMAAASSERHGSSVCESAAASSVPIASTSGTSPNTIATPPLSSASGPEACEDDGEYCSVECAQRASLYRPLEIKHRVALEQVRSLILSKGAVTLNVLPLEMAAMMVRLFLMVVTIHRRLSAKRRLDDSNRRNPESAASRAGSDKVHTWPDAEPMVAGGLACSQCASPSPPVCVETALRRLGVFPLSTEPIAGNKLDELKIVYEALTTDFKVDDKATFSYELMTQLYAYVSAYFTPVDLYSLEPPEAEGRRPGHQTVFYLPHYVGCIEVAKTISYTTAPRPRQAKSEAVRSGDDGDDLFSSRVMGRPSSFGDAAGSSGSRDSTSLSAGIHHSGQHTHSHPHRPHHHHHHLPHPQQLHSVNGANGVVTVPSADPAAASTDEANCVVQMAPRPALLELVTVAPVKTERKLRCVPVTIALSSDVA